MLKCWLQFVFCYFTVMFVFYLHVLPFHFLGNCHAQSNIHGV